MGQCLEIFHHEHGREATSLPSPAVPLGASRGQEQARRCMGWKDKEHRREKQKGATVHGVYVNTEAESSY